jgi:taurine dioxygenase
MSGSIANCPAFEVAPLEGNPAFGAQVIGLQPQSIAEATVRQALRALFTQKGVLVFRGVSGADFQIELSKCFGELMEHVTREARSARRELATAHYKPQEDSIWEVDGEQRGNWLPWHTDTFYKDQINRGGMLRPIVLPSHLGLTGFIDKVAAYEALPEDLKKRVEGLEVIYKFNFDYDKQKFATTRQVRPLRHSPGVLSIHARAQDFPRVLHPIVFTHKELGRKAFNVSPSMAIGIKGMENEEGDALLREVIKYGVDERRAYYHTWRMDDMVLWDNWRVLHSATGGPADEVRWLERTTIAGDYGYGRMESSDATSAATPSMDG